MEVKFPFNGLFIVNGVLINLNTVQNIAKEAIKACVIEKDVFFVGCANSIKGIQLQKVQNEYL